MDIYKADISDFCIDRANIVWKFCSDSLFLTVIDISVYTSPVEKQYLPNRLLEAICATGYVDQSCKLAPGKQLANDNNAARRDWRIEKVIDPIDEVISGFVIVGSEIGDQRVNV
ncbi:hypothetical protein NXS19_003974 [Fusarium pseudograminearum]|nr:hypothetical protein NXS19_003974 [Fusarium pseudograminearum]